MLYTVGHSTRSLAELAELLVFHGVQRLIDVRSIPRSATNPQFNAEGLAEALEPFGLSYTPMLALGGRRPKSKTVPDDVNAGWQVRAFHNYADYALTQPFRDALRALCEMAARETCAIMCAEAVWWRCHRRIVADHLLVRGVPVVHLLARDKAEPAKLTPFARVEARHRVTYPAS